MAVLMFSISAMAQTTSTDWNKLIDKKLDLKKYCKGEVHGRHIDNIGEMKNNYDKEFIILHDDNTITWVFNDRHNVYEVRLDEEQDALNVKEVIKGRDMEWFQLMKREGNKLKIWASDGYVRLFQIDEDYDPEDDPHYRHKRHHHDKDDGFFDDDEEDEDYHKEHHHEKDHHHDKDDGFWDYEKRTHHDDDDDDIDDKSIWDILFD